MPYNSENAKKNLSAQEDFPKAETRISGPDEHPWGALGIKEAPPEGTLAANGVKAAGNAVAPVRRLEHLKDKARFALLFRQGRSWSNDLVVLRSLPNGLEGNRYGIAVGKHLGKATVRNLWRRRLWGCLRKMAIKPGWDLVFVVRRQAAGADYQRLETAVWDSLRRARLLGEGLCRD